MLNMLNQCWTVQYC